MSDDQLKTHLGQIFDRLTSSTGNLTSEEVCFLEEATRKQADSLYWHEQRKGRITSSNFFEVSRHMLALKCYPTSLVKKIMKYTPDYPNVQSMRWGRENEPKARQAYSEYLLEHHQDVNVSLAGLVVDPSYPYLGASPDGFVSCSCCEDTGLLKIKCSYKYRNELPIADVALADKNYFLEIDPDTDAVQLRKSHKYYYQVQGQIAICKRRFCDFVCWTPMGLFVQRIEKDESFARVIFPDLTNFFCKYLLPELVTQKLKNSSTPCITEKLYCTCQKPASGRMVGCDNSKCRMEWFHFGCVGLKRKPRGKWYCPECKPSRS